MKVKELIELLIKIKMDYEVSLCIKYDNDGYNRYLECPLEEVVITKDEGNNEAYVEFYGEG